MNCSARASKFVRCLFTLNSIQWILPHKNLQNIQFNVSSSSDCEFSSVIIKIWKFYSHSIECIFYVIFRMKNEVEDVKLRLDGESHGVDKSWLTIQFSSINSRGYFHFQCSANIMKWCNAFLLLIFSVDLNHDHFIFERPFDMPGTYQV